MRTAWYLLWSALAAAAGILLEVWFAFPLLFWAGGAVIFLGASALLAWQRKGKALFWMGLLFLAWAGALRMGLETALWQEESLYIAGHRGTYTVVVSSPALSVEGEEGYVRHTVALESVIFPDGEERRLKGSLYLYSPHGSPSYGVGSRLTAAGEVRPLRLYGNPGKMDLSGRYKSMGLVGRIYTEKAGDVVYQGPSGKYRAAALAEDVRTSLKKTFSYYLDSRRLPVMMSLLFGGNYDDIPERVIQDFAVTGVLHILSVSGSHMALLFGFLLLLGKWLHLPRRLVLALAVVLVLFYALLSGFVPPVIRSAAMSILAAGGVFLRREKSSLNLLGAAVMGMLFWNPFYLADVSFQLSCGASAGILLFYRPFSRALSAIPFLPRWAGEGLSLTGAAQILTLPIVLHDFHRLPLYSGIANLVVTPLLEWVIMAGLAAALASAVVLPLAGGILHGADYLLWGALHMNEGLASLPGARASMGGLSLGEMILYYGLILLFLSRSWWRKKRRGVQGAVLAGCLLLGGAAWGWIMKPEVVCYVPDLGASRGAIITSGKGRIIYYRDGGLPVDMGKRELTSLLEYEGIFEADLLIMDISGLRKPSPFTLGIPVKEIWFAGGQGKRICATLLQGQQSEIAHVSSVRTERQGIAIGGNEDRWYLSGSTWGIFLDGGKGEWKNFPEPAAHTLWIGGKEGFLPMAEEALLRRLRPDRASYSGGGAGSGEDEDLFHLLEIPLTRPERDGMITFEKRNGPWRMTTWKDTALWQW